MRVKCTYLIVCNYDLEWMVWGRGIGKDLLHCWDLFCLIPHTPHLHELNNFTTQNGQNLLSNDMWALYQSGNKTNFEILLLPAPVGGNKWKAWNGRRQHMILCATCYKSYEMVQDMYMFIVPVIWIPHATLLSHDQINFVAHGGMNFW